MIVVYLFAGNNGTVNECTKNGWNNNHMQIDDAFDKSPTANFCGRSSETPTADTPGSGGMRDPLEGREATKTNSVHLERRMGLFSGIALILGTQIGTLPFSMISLLISVQKVASGSYWFVNYTLYNWGCSVRWMVNVRVSIWWVDESRNNVLLININSMLTSSMDLDLITVIKHLEAILFL